MYIGEIIKEYRTNNHLSQRTFAKRTTLSPSYINTLEKIYNPKTGKPYSVTTDVAAELANAMFISIEDLLNMLNSNDETSALALKNSFNLLSSIPILSSIKPGSNYFAKENIIGAIDIPKNLASSGNLFALKVKGDYMFPAIIENDFIVIKEQNNFENGDIVVATINTEEPIISRAKKSEAGMFFQPLNTKYEPIIFTNKEIKSIPVVIIGVVKRLERNFK